MPRHRIVGWALLLSIGLGLSWLGYRIVLRPALVEEGQRAPEFDLVDLHGAPIALATGEVVLLDFWQQTCRPCLAAIPVFNRLHDDYDEHGLELVGVHVGEAGDRLARVIDERAPRYPVAVDDGALAHAFGVHSFPTLVALHPDGRVAWVHRKGAAEEHLRRDLEALLPEARGEARPR